MTEPKIYHNVTEASAWVERFADNITVGGSVLDLACGGGRHGRLFLAKGHPVTFLDKNITTIADLAKHPSAEIIEADLEGEAGWPLKGRHFDGIVITNYLWRPILTQIFSTLAPGGTLIYETFAEGNEAFGRPRNPDFLLRSGELLEAVRGHLDVLAYGQCQQAKPQPRVIQHIAARRSQ